MDVDLIQPHELLRLLRLAAEVLEWRQLLPLRAWLDLVDYVLGRRNVEVVNKEVLAVQVLLKAWCLLERHVPIEASLQDVAAEVAVDRLEHLAIERRLHFIVFRADLFFTLALVEVELQRILSPREHLLDAGVVVALETARLAVLVETLAHLVYLLDLTRTEVLLSELGEDPLTVDVFISKVVVQLLQVLLPLSKQVISGLILEGSGLLRHRIR